MQHPNLILDTAHGIATSAHAKLLAFGGHLDEGAYVSMGDPDDSDSLEPHDLGCVITLNPPGTITPKLIGKGLVKLFAFGSTEELNAFDMDLIAPLQPEPVITHAEGGDYAQN